MNGREIIAQKYDCDNNIIISPCVKTKMVRIIFQTYKLKKISVMFFIRIFVFAIRCSVEAVPRSGKPSMPQMHELSVFFNSSLYMNTSTN